MTSSGKPPISRVFSRTPYLLLAGDAIVLALVTVAGFATHQVLGAPLWRILTTFLPLLLGWLLAGWSLGVFDLEQAKKSSQLWRPLYAMLLAGPFATWLRSVMLGQGVVMTNFVFVMSGLSALALLAWRVLAVIIFNRKA